MAGVCVQCIGGSLAAATAAEEDGQTCNAILAVVSSILDEPDQPGAGHFYISKSWLQCAPWRVLSKASKAHTQHISD